MNTKIKDNIKDIIVLLFFVCITSLRAQYNFAPVTQLITDSLTKVGPNCGLMLIRNDTVIYKQYFGTWTDNTYQPIASGSKMPSMATIMTLVDQGLISLNDTVQNYLPSFSAKPIMTLRHLMSHTSGLPGNATYINDNSLTLQEAVDSIGIYTPMTTYAPGTAFQYGGVSMHVAGRMAEIASGLRWDSLFIQKFATPLSLTHIDYLGLGATTNFRIAGGMGTTMPDYAKLVNVLYHYGNFNGNQLIDTSSVIAMQSDQTNGVPLIGTPYQNDTLRDSLRYGFGTWLEKINPNTNIPVQLGDQGAFGFTPWIDRCRNLAVVFFVKRTLNSIQPTHTALRNLIEQIVPLSLITPTISLAGASLQSSSIFGNQWLLNGVLISGATNQTYTPIQNGTYTVRVTNENGCDATSIGYSYNSASIDSGETLKQISVYPNPSNTNVIIKTSNSIFNISVCDILGNEIVKLEPIKVGQLEIDVSKLQDGVYILKIFNDEYCCSQKIIVQH